MTQRTICLVSCVSKKGAMPVPAKDLYISPWFVKARRYAEQVAPGAWYILSAAHGMVEPDVIVAPYEQSLNKMDANQRRVWSWHVIRQMDTDLLGPIDKIVLLAGARYRVNLMEYLRGRARDVSVPMEGMGIGRQLQWLGRREDLQLSR